jgi:hypothetical protein
MTTAPSIKSRPIIMTGESVPQIQAGAKTMTRRMVKPQPPAQFLGDWAFPLTNGGRYAFGIDYPKRRVWPPENEPGIKCPFAKEQELWVKEKCIEIGHERTMRNGQYVWPKLEPEVGRQWFDGNCFYAASEPNGSPLWDEPHGTLSAMYMPRWASRLTLFVTSVRAERLFAISEADAVREGCANVADFRRRWEALHGEWKDVWVWVVGFTKKGLT